MIVFMKKIVKVCVVLFIVVLAFFLYIFLSSRPNLKKVENLYWENEKEFTEFANYFLWQKEIRNIFNNIDDDKSCNIINHWSLCPKKWNRWGSYTWEIKKGVFQRIYLNNLEEVLLEEDIARNNYDKTLLFMKKYWLDWLGKDDSSIELDMLIWLVNLRYYAKKNVIFKEDHEYIYVKKINDNWFVFVTDWN